MDTKDLTGLPVSDEKSLHDVIRQLCIFSSRGSELYRDEVIEHLAFNALAQFDPGGHSPGEVRSGLRQMIGFDIDYEQIRSALCRLVEKETVYANDDLSQPNTKFGLKTDLISELNQNYKNQEAFEQNVLDEWRQEVASRKTCRAGTAGHRTRTKYQIGTATTACLETSYYKTVSSGSYLDCGICSIRSNEPISKR